MLRFTVIKFLQYVNRFHFRSAFRVWVPDIGQGAYKLVNPVFFPRLFNFHFQIRTQLGENKHFHKRH